MRAIVAELRWLFAFAPKAGPDADRVAVIAAAVVDVLLDAQDPRTSRSKDLARRVQQARAAGVPIAALCERFDRSRSQIHRLLKVA